MTGKRNTIVPYRSDLKETARKLRRESTYAETLLWQEIRRRKVMGYQFHRQVPILDYVVDFYCHELMLAMEIDGESHDSDEAKSYDKRRQARLEERGVHFLRFNDLRIKRDIEKVVEAIENWIRDRVRE